MNLLAILVFGPLVAAGLVVWALAWLAAAVLSGVDEALRESFER